MCAEKHYPGQSRIDEWLAHLPPSWNLPIEDYLSHSYVIKDLGADKGMPLFRWDNYVSIYLAVFGDFVQRGYFATHRDGDDPNYQNAQFVEPWELPSNLSFWLGEERVKPWIVNIDLDYFFWHESEKPGLMVSDAYLEKCFSALREKIEDKTVAVTTIALTPSEDFTGGWAPSEQLAERVLGFLGIDFRLP